MIPMHGGPFDSFADSLAQGDVARERERERADPSGTGRGTDAEKLEPKAGV
jgi:hypothetical protein